MNHTGTHTLETERLILRRYRPEDAPAMFRNWASDPEVTRYLTWPTHASEDVTRAIITDWVARYEEPDVYHWGLELKTTHEVIGDIAVVRIAEKVLEAGSYQDFPGFEDYCLWIRMLKRGCRGWNLPEALVDMRIGNGLSGRRGDRGYVRSVVRFQRFLLREGVTTPVDFIMNCGVRIAVGLMPDGVRDLFYKRFLRKT